eukprot:scaffold744_cov240-Pinguiococcus_pyrenoidosus.AAC.6
MIGEGLLLAWKATQASPGFLHHLYDSCTTHEAAPNLTFSADPRPPSRCLNLHLHPRRRAALACYSLATSEVAMYSGSDLLEPAVANGQELQLSF